jgi:cytochrome c peroxidase
LAAAVRALAASRGIGPLPAPPRVSRALSLLGQALAFDKILSGNRDISCMTCHLPGFATGDGRSLSVGQGARGLGPARVHPNGVFIPRNAPPLFNLSSLPNLFWDGRVSVDEYGRFHTPAGAKLSRDMTRGFQFGAISALGLFPVLSRSEMRAAKGNELAAIPDDQEPAIWAALMKRLGSIWQYRVMFEAAYPGVPFRRMTFAHASNAMAGFFIDRFTFTRSPWDGFLAGNDNAMTAEQLQAAQGFLGGRCAQCHNGPAFTDNRFHNVAVAQFGPGQGDGPGGNDDFGRMRETGIPGDRYAFRTTPLRNVELTGPYGHDGAFPSLRDFIDHYSESDIKLKAFNPMTLEPLLQTTLVPNLDQILATRDSLLDGFVLPGAAIDNIVRFMGALTDPAARDLRRTIPLRVPSGLPIDR